VERIGSLAQAAIFDHSEEIVQVSRDIHETGLDKNMRTLAWRADGLGRRRVTGEIRVLHTPPILRAGGCHLVMAIRQIDIGRLSQPGAIIFDRAGPSGAAAVQRRS
jgi:hypothetical protein